MNSVEFVLASSSRYRQQQLANAGIAALCIAPDIDEAPLPHEDAPTLALRLAESKARKVATRYQQNQQNQQTTVNLTSSNSIEQSTPAVIIIAADQTACINNNPDHAILSKPLTHSRALQQLLACQNTMVTFFSALSVMNVVTGEVYSAIEPTHVHFNALSETAIDAYLRAEQPYDCAGSFKVEGLGGLLFNKIESRDPSALIGLPIILLRELCAQHKIDLLAIACAQKRG